MTVASRNQGALASTASYESDLKHAYEKACRDVEAVCITEKNRKLRLQSLLLEDENEELHAQLEEDDERIEQLENSIQDLQSDLNLALSESENAQTDLRIKTRENETLKMELNSLNGITTDSNKILSEKLTLARELSSLKPELDHLRSLASSHQTLLSEKLALQRQVNTLQVEVENEKRSTQRIISRDGKSQAEDAKLEASLEAAQSDLLKEKRERQKSDREHQKTTTELQNRITTLESRLDSFRTKLKSTKESLKDTQTELQKAQASKNVSAGTAPTNARKRTISDMQADTMIGTPGDMPAAKRGKIYSTLPGEKSTFSITPFLNRTTSVPPESPAHGSNEGGNEEIDKNESNSPSAARKPKIRPSLTQSNDILNPKLQAKPQKKDVGGASESSRKLVNKPVSKAPARKASTAPRLAQVAEEEAEVPITGVGRNKNVKTSEPPVVDVVSEASKGERKKRKLLGGGLGKTLFDEEEGDGTKGDRKPLGTAKSLGAIGKGVLGGPKVASKAATGFGAISPLKKDRRAVVV